MNARDGALGAGRFDRLRWRLRGAWLWPTFTGATILESALLHWQPVEGDSTGWVAGLLVAGCLNVIAVALVGGLGGRWLRRRRPDMPRVVADNYAGTGVLALVGAALVLAGIAHRPAIADHRAEFGEQSLAVRQLIAIHGDAYMRAHVNLADSVQIDDNLFRTCVPSADPKRALCLIIDTSHAPPVVKLDASREPNATFNARGGFR